MAAAAQRGAVTIVNGNAIAVQVGDLKVAGVVLVGALSTHLPFAVETWERGHRPQRAGELARDEPRRFAAGRKAEGA